MDVLYMCFEPDYSQKGVEKKINYEIKAFKSSGINVEKVVVKKNNILIRLLPFQGKFRWRQYSAARGVSAIYIRNGFSSYPFISMLKKIRKNNENVKIILEIGMYPYDKEFVGPFKKLLLTRDRIYRRLLKKYIDRVTINTPFEEAFGIKTIQFVNPIDVGSITIPQRLDYRKDNTINLLAVASLAFYYGYDRMIRGIANYYRMGGYSETNIIFHVVGDGAILSELKEMSTKLGVDEHIVFYGFKQGKELENIYEIADIGIDVFGGHRKDDYYFGTIKSREYMSKGIPFITEYPIPEDIKPISKYILKVPADESDIDIESIIKFFQNICKEERKTTIENMRGFAEKYCDLTVAMNPIVDYMKGDIQ